MTATLLATKRVEKPWGRHDLWPGFADPAPDARAGRRSLVPDRPMPATPELLIKYLFTSEKAVGAGPSRRRRRRTRPAIRAARTNAG